MGNCVPQIFKQGKKYPEEAYVRVRVLCFTIFRSDKEKKDPVKEKPAKDVSVERESERETAKESQAETDPLAAEEASPDEAATDQEVLQPEENDDAERQEPVLYLQGLQFRLAAYLLPFADRYA